MNKKTMPTGKRFQKGQSGNPGGQTKLDAAIRKLTKEQYRELATLLSHTTIEGLNQILDKPETTALTTVIIKCILAAADKGDIHALDKFLDRLIGKVKDEVDVTVKPRPLIIRRRNGETVVLGTDLDKDETE